jgi:ubiquitin fusion degradation protein 1
LEKGNKVLLPSNTLATLANGTMPHPLIFRINSMRSKKIVYCGVLEFTAPEGAIIMPNWIFNDLNLQEEEMVNIFMVPKIPTAHFLKLRPHQTAFINLPDPRAL